MCGRYTITATPDQLALYIQGDGGSNPPPAPPAQHVARYNAAPTQQLPVLLNAGERQIEFLRWGLIPSWTKQLDNKYSMINARAETLAEKPSFKRALERRRCLVFADSFYEWQKSADGKHKTPMRIMLESRDLFAFAGLWETWRSPDDEIIRSFTVITTAANDFMKPIHDRMPVILRREDEQHWLDDGAGMAVWNDLLRQYPPDLMKAYPVSKRVNVASVDDPSLIAPLH
jgi:putative SOS response-associated peptidase YedK